MAASGSQANERPSFEFSLTDFDISDARKELEDHGVVVITNVIPQDDCDNYISQINDWLKQFGDDFPANISSIIHKYGVAHLEPAWGVRLQVKPIFSALWQTEKLLTSTDGIAVGRPPEISDAKFGSMLIRDGLHFDQGPQRQGLQAYQGAVYLEEAEENDWCFAVMDKSHLHHATFFEHFKPSSRSEFRRLKNKEIEFLLKRGCHLRRVPVPKGAIVLWDSRTVHAGAPPVFGRKNIDRWRYIVFVSQTPAPWARQEDMFVKQEAYYKLRCSRHWSSHGASNFLTGNSPFDVPQLPDVAKSIVAKQLAGVEPYNFEDGKPNGPSFTPSHGSVFN